MAEFTREAILERLKHSVQLLASPPGIQLQLLPQCVCKADELALEFDNWREIALHKYGKQFSIDQVSAMADINEKLDWLSGAGSEYWTDEAVSASPEWQNVRHLATEVLKSFGWPAETPPSYAQEYRPANPVHNLEEN